MITATQRETLRQARQYQKLSQAIVSALIGIAPNSLARLERGELSPTLSTAQKWARVLGYRLTVKLWWPR